MHAIRRLVPVFPENAHFSWESILGNCMRRTFALVVQHLSYSTPIGVSVFNRQAISNKHTLNDYTVISVFLVLIRVFTLCLFILECSKWRKFTLDNWFMTCASLQMISLHALPALNWKQYRDACIAIGLGISWSIIKAVLQSRLGVMTEDMKTQYIVFFLITVFDFIILHQKKDRWLEVCVYLKHSIRHALYSHTTRLSADYHDSIDDVSIEQFKIDCGVESSIYHIERILFAVIPHTITFFHAAYQLNIAFNPVGPLFLTAATLFLFLTYMILTGSNNQRPYLQTRYALSKIERRIISNWTELTLYGQQEYELKKYHRALLESEQRGRNNKLFNAVLFELRTYIKGLGENLTKMLFSHFHTYGSTSSHQIINVGSYWVSLVESFWVLCEHGIQKPVRLPMIEDTLLLLEKEPTVREIAEAPSLKLEGGRIEFIDVHFGYSPDQTILKGINMTCLPGKLTAIVGPTGAGKSTLMDLIWRRYDVNSGSIHIDGQNIQAVSLASLRQELAIVSQFPNLLPGYTIMENIRYAKKGASDKEVKEASKLANLDCEIANPQMFPQGYKSTFGKDVSNLSGGQKQRLAIARAVLRGSKIILLDEPTSSLDAKNEFQVKTMLSKKFKGCTMLVIAHRLSTIIHADNIVFMDQGRVVESGDHLGLISKQRKYAEFIRMQFGGMNEMQFNETNEMNHRRSRSI